MVRTPKNVIVALLGLALLSAGGMLQGCMSTRHRQGMPIRDTDVQQIVKGRTTMNDVISLFGEPTRSTPMGDETLFTYVYSVTKGSALALPGFGSGDSATEEDKLTVTFDKDKLVKAFSLRRGIGVK